MAAIHSSMQGVLVGLLAGGCLSMAACFGSSSGGSGGTVTFDSGGGIDGFGADSTLPDDSGAETGVDAEAGSDAITMADSSTIDAADSAATDSAGDSATEAGDAGGALIRFANLVSDLASAVDFCVAPSGGSFTTPYLNTQGVPAGLAYKEVSEYAALPPSSGFKVRVVAAGSSGCGSALAGDMTVGASTAASPTTVTFTGVSGDGGPAAILTGLSDDAASTITSGIRFRAVHAAPSVGAVDFEIGVTPYTVAMQTAVPYGATFASSTMATGAPAPDSNGYLVPGWGTAQVTVLLSGVETTSFYVANNGVNSASVTAFLVGAAGSMTDPLGFVDCDELATPLGHKAICPFNSAPPVTIPTRIFHGAPDQGAIDVCAAIGPAAYSASLIAAAGNAGGATFLQLTGDLTSIPANTDFKVAFVPVGQPCATATFTAIGSSVRFQELTVALFETFGMTTGYRSYIFDTLLTANANASVIAFGSLANQTAGGQKVDIYGTEYMMSEVPLMGMLGGANYGGGTMLAPDTWSFRVVDDASMTDVYNKSGFSLVANETYLAWWLNVGNATAGTLAQCPLSQRTSDSLITCPN